MNLITTHQNADFDGLASMVAARKLYQAGTLVLPGGAQETVRNFLAQHDLELMRLKDVDLDQITRLVLVDTQNPDRLGPLKPLCDNPAVAIHVYDHHPLTGARVSDAPAVRADLRVVEPVGATTTIMVEHLRQQRLTLTPFEATVLALGLYEETGSLIYPSTTPRDLTAVAFLLEAGADLNLVSNTLRHHLDPDQIALLNDLLLCSETYYLNGRKVLVTTSTYDRYRGDLAHVVTKLTEMEGYDAVIAAIALEEKVQIIGRSRQPNIDVGQFAQEFGGGGHAGAAAATVKGRTLVEVKAQITKLLIERYRPILLARDVMTRPVKAIREHLTVREAEPRMTRYGVNVLPVLDAKDRYHGLLTRETIQKALFHKLGATTVQDLAQTDQYTAAPDTPFHEIESRMVERNQRFVPILQDGKVSGVITRTDLLRTLHDDVLAASHARMKGEMPEVSGGRRNLREPMKQRLPERAFARLVRVGQIADQMGVAAFVVGGFVRDLLLSIENLDIDVVVEGDGIAFARMVGQEEGAHVKAYDKFGTAVLVFPDKFKIDVATARTEYYEYPTALPTVEESSIKKDLYRRDFTINTLSIRLNSVGFGDLLDFYGGQRDLKEKVVRVLHSLSFVEDPTRVFRAVRFEQRFGFRLGKETLALIKGAAKMDLFRRLSGHRLLGELVNLFSEQEPRRTVARLAELDLLRFVHPSLRHVTRLPTLLKPVEDALDWYKLLYLDRKMKPWLVYFMALMEVIPPKSVAETLKRLAMPAGLAENIRAARAATNVVLRRLAQRPPLRPSKVYDLLCGLSDETLLFLMSQAKQDSVARHISSYLTAYQHVKPMLTGEELKAMGLKPGPLYKKILTRLRNARLDGEVKTESEERDLVKRIAKA